jgi:PAS domain S-box-containing protein
VTQLKGLMDNVFASIASGVITTDTDNRITLANRAAETILGFQEKKIDGQALEDTLPSLAHALSKYIDTVWQTDVSLTGLDFNSDLPGRGPVALRFSISPLKDAARITQGMAIVLDDLTDTKRLEAAQRLFERMVSPAVIEQLDPNQLQLVGQRAQITTLFADIRGFTSFSESVSPERLVAVLNCYLAAAAEAILEQEGTIDKFLGDAVMAWFNAPIPQPDHTLRAVRSALDLQKSICSLQDELPDEHFLAFGVGIHFGEAVLGLIGTEKRLEYTAIGDSVNTARRIQERAAAGQILISAEAYQRVSGQVIALPVADVLAKGKSQPLQVYEVIGLK